MKSSKNVLDTNNLEQQILALASMFDSRFSIDWVQDLSKAKATFILQTFETAAEKEILKKGELGIFSFRELKTRDSLRQSIPPRQRQDLHRQIAELMINEATDNEQAVFAAAGHLLHVPNNLDGCRILTDAGDRYRQKGMSKEALKCYDKVIVDLENKKGVVEKGLYVKAIIGHSKDRLSISTPEIAKTSLALLKKGLSKAENLKDKSLQCIVLLHMASLEYELIHYRTAQKYYFKGRQMARELNDPAVEKTLDACSLVHYCYSGLFLEAVKKYESIESVFSRKNADYRLSLKMGIILGVSYAYIGQIPQSLGMLNQLRDNALELNDDDALARASIYIGFALIMKNDLENGAIQIFETLKSSKKIDKLTRSFALLLQAHIYYEKNEFQKSHDFLKKAVKNRQQYSYTGHGQLFEFCLAMEKKTYPEIQGLSLEDEIKTSINIGNIYKQGIAYRYLAWVQEQKKQPEKNILNSLKTSLSLLKKSGGQLETAKTHEALARFYIGKKDKPKARRHVENAAKILQKSGKRRVSQDLSPLLKDFHIKEDLMEEILSFGPQIVEIRDIKKVAQRILSTVIKITQAERGGIFLYLGESSSSPINLLASKNLSTEDMEKPGFKLSTQMILESAKTGKEKLDILNSESSTGNQNDEAIKSRICVPLLRRGKTIGVLYHDNRLFQSTFKKQDLKILSYFASLAAIALDNAQAYEKINTLNQRLSEEKNYLEEQQLEHLHFEDFVAASKKIKKVLTLVERVADTEATVLILGETGVGKEMVARAIHQQSRRKNKPFIRVNCSAFPETLIASELFGHEKGSFTGASKRRVGRFELADTGTLFLDEIGDISMDIQVRLLRVLQTKRFERVGGSESIHSDFRLLTATNRNLEKAVSDGRFRQDLYYRLNVFPIYVPPLRERTDDITPLAIHFLKKHSDKMNKSFKGIPEKEMDKLTGYHWPGNVRELENVIERGVILNTNELFSIPELSLEETEESISGQFTLKEMERRFILDTLQRTKWKIYGPGGAARLLGLNHSTLYSRMKKLGIQTPKKDNKKQVQ